MQQYLTVMLLYGLNYDLENKQGYCEEITVLAQVNFPFSLVTRETIESVTGNLTFAILHFNQGENLSVSVLVNNVVLNTFFKFNLCWKPVVFFFQYSKNIQHCKDISI